MDNENGTTAVVTAPADETKSVEETVAKSADAIDSVTIEPIKNVGKTNNTDENKLESTVNSTESEKLNDIESINKTTTTTVTVQVTQTKVTVNDKESDSKTDAGDMVSTASNIAEAAITAASKCEQSTDAKLNEIPTESNDIEMLESNDDIEMKDVTSTDEPQPTIPTSTDTEKETSAVESKVIEADSAIDNALANNEAEQKIDDVEKNISNLFNGDDNVVSTNSIKSSICETEAGTTAIEKTLKNGSEAGSSSIDAIKDNNDLVSILAGNDKFDDKATDAQAISSSQGAEANSSQDVANESLPKSVENKHLKIASTPSSSTGSATTTAKVYNSTPIQKQFEISSENVSAISESAVDEEHILGDKSTRQEIISSHSSATNEKLSKYSSSSPTAISGSESEQTSSDNLTRFTKAVRTLNGSSDETDASIIQPEAETSNQPEKVPTTPKAKAQSVTISSENHVYDVNIGYDNSELIYFSVERLDANKTNSTSDKSSIGSVHSASEIFALPTRCATVTSTNSTLSSSSSELGASHTVTMTLDKTKHEIKGTSALCQFVIEHFQKIRTSLGGSEESTKASNETTPVASSGRRGRGANATPTTPSVQASGSKRKRGAAQQSPSVGEPDVDDQPKSAKKAKKTHEPATPTTTTNYPEKAVLARWVDKKFYAGRVIDQKPNNKFVVLFEDGAKKVLPEEHIVFGEQNILPLLNEAVHALVKEDTYEPGIVQTVETKDDGTYYTVLCESTTVTVTASDIYLEDDQAKVIISKHASDNPEPGFSGGINTRKDRRQKRAESNRPSQWFSESDVSDIVESDSRPASPVTVLEAVDGVQPELQHTQKESELVRICYLMERYGDNFKTVNLDNVLGPIATSNFLKNKCFLLTCTIPIKSIPNGTPNERQVHKSNGYDLSNRNMAFSEVPFFKDHLKQQIEAAGGTVYNNFENVPTNKYRNCFLLAPFPCITAKYVQCLAANIPAVSHEWIVECCQRNKLVSKDDYLLPSGWSIIDNMYRLWTTGRGRDQRKNIFNKTTIILTSQQNEFVLFWSRVCKSAGAKIRLVKSMTDLTATTKGYILLDDEFPPEYQSRAERFRIPIVSTVWVVQSLISGKVCDPYAHLKLTQLYEDDYF